MAKYKLVRICPINSLLKKADIDGYFNAIDTYLISKNPYIVEGNIDTANSLAEIGKKYQVQTQWEVFTE